MATPAVSFNPAITTNFPGTFSIQSQGYVQGTFLDDPAVRYQLAGGILASTETIPMWGGVGITEAVPGLSAQQVALNGTLTRATAYTNLTGFSVFTQGSAMVMTPQSRVPTSGSYGAVNFFRFGSNARIVVACSSTLAASVVGGAINQQVSWDFVNQVLIAFSTTALNCKVLAANVGNSKIVTYVSPYANWTHNGSTCVIQI